jgi:hypothetical protein
MKLQQWRKKARSLYGRHAKAEEDGWELMRDMRDILDELRKYQYPPPIKDGDGEDDEEMETGEKDGEISRSDSADDGSDDETVTIENYFEYKAREEKAAAEESVEVGKTMEETQLSARDVILRDESFISPGTSDWKLADMTEGSFVKTTVTEETTITQKGGVTKKTIVRTKTVVTSEEFSSKGLWSGD